MTSFLRAAWQRLTRSRPESPPAASPVSAPVRLRPPAPEAAQQLAAFWRWFEQVRPRLEHELRAGFSAELQEELSAEVKALHPELAWEAGRGAGSTLELSLSTEGQFSLRRLTEAWRQAAPEVPGWRFHPERPATARFEQAVLHFAGQQVALEQLRFRLEDDVPRARVDLTVWHPAFETMEAGARESLGLLALDALLGADELERWVGNVDTATEATEAFVTPEALRARVAALAAAPHDTLAFVQGKDARGHEVMASLHLSLKRLDHLAYEDQLVVRIAYRTLAEKGMPSAEEHQAAQALEDQLVESLRGLALHYGHVVSGGRLEVLFYVADKRAAEGRLAAWRERARGWKVERSWQHDPEWRALLKW
jgi:hypothetical protein